MKSREQTVEKRFDVCDPNGEVEAFSVGLAECLQRWSPIGRKTLELGLYEANVGDVRPIGGNWLRCFVRVQ